MTVLLGFVREDAQSHIAPSMYDLADRLSECDGFRRLFDDAAIEEARTKVHIQSQTDPFEGNQFTVEQLEDTQILLHANIVLRGDNPVETSEPLEFADGEGKCPDEAWTLTIELRRQARRAEIAENGEDMVLLDFIDCACSIVHQLHEKANGKSPIIRNVRLVGAPRWNDEITVSGQGMFMFCWIDVDCGDREGG